MFHGNKLLFYIIKRSVCLKRNFEKNVENFAEKFASMIFCRTFAIPNQTSGGGEMVDTLL